MYRFGVQWEPQARDQRGAETSPRSQSTVARRPSLSATLVSQPSSLRAFSTDGQRRCTSTAKLGRCSNSSSSGALPHASQMVRAISETVSSCDAEMLNSSFSPAADGRSCSADHVGHERPGCRPRPIASRSRTQSEASGTRRGSPRGWETASRVPETSTRFIRFQRGYLGRLARIRLAPAVFPAAPVQPTHRRT